MAEPGAPIINAEADRQLGRIIVRYGLATLILLVIAPFGMAFVNIPQSSLYGDRRFLDTLSIFVILLPFFVGINRLFAARLQLGRTLVQQKRYGEAVAALDPFAGPTQRFLDTSGEAHYLLAVSYARLGQTAKAQASRVFLLKHRPGQWADLLSKAAQENRPRPPKRPLRRRH